MACEICSDTGMIGYHKPMRGADGETRMVFVPRCCACKAGEDAANRYVQNLKEGRAGMQDIHVHQQET